MEDLVTWLRAQLDDDERLARAAEAFPYGHPSDAPWERERIIAERVGGKSRARATHQIVAIFANPARVLAEVDAKRRILDEIVPEAVDKEYATEQRDLTREPWLGDRLLRLLAVSYADRPGYREEWRP